MDEVAKQKLIEQNHWYTRSHFRWANKPSIVPIYNERARFFRKCINGLRTKPDDTINLLDVGCGDGYWLDRLSEDTNLKLSGLDYNELRVQRLKEKMPDMEIMYGDIFELDINKKYDVVLLNQVIEHVHDDVGLLRKMRELVRPNGSLIIGTPNEGTYLQMRIIRKKRKNPDWYYDHVHFYKEREIKRKITEAGFTINRIMREVCFIGNYRIFYKLTKRRWGFKILQFLTVLFPSQCTDYYFECKPNHK